LRALLRLTKSDEYIKKKKRKRRLQEAIIFSIPKIRAPSNPCGSRKQVTKYPLSERDLALESTIMIRKRSEKHSTFYRIQIRD